MVLLLRQRNFALLWLAGLFSLAGDWAVLAVLPFYVYERTDSTFASAMVFLTTRYPGFCSVRSPASSSTTGTGGGR